MTPEIERVVTCLADLCLVWGGNLTIVDEATFDDLFRRPYTERLPGFFLAPNSASTGIHQASGTIFACESEVDINTIIHEMGHVFADTTETIEFSDEWSWLGFEIALAHSVDAFELWSENNGTYGLGPPHPDTHPYRDYTGYEWADLTTRGQRYVAADRLLVARLIGCVDRDGFPRARRDPRWPGRAVR